MKNVAVIGAGMNKWGVREAGWKDLVQEAGKNLFDDIPNLDRKDIDSLFVSAVQPERWVYQSHVAPIVAELLGVHPYRFISRQEMACASGNVSIKYAWSAIMSGLSDIALCLGVEKMNTSNMDLSQANMICVGDREFDGTSGFTAPPFFAMIAQRHMLNYGTTKEQMAMVSEKNHNFGAYNQNAQFTKQIPLEKIINAKIIAPPLGLFDCSAMTDGACAVILASEEKAKELTDSPMWILGGASCNLGSNVVNQFGDLDNWPALRRSAEEAYKIAGIRPNDIDIAQTHDCFTISEIIEYEELGFCKKGEGGKFIEDGRSQIGGDVAVNTDGGLLANGHPLGATGIRQVWETFNQFRGTVPKERYVDGAEIGLTHNLGGMAQAHHILIFGKEKRSK